MFGPGAFGQHLNTSQTHRLLRSRTFGRIRLLCASVAQYHNGFQASKPDLTAASVSARDNGNIANLVDPSVSERGTMTLQIKVVEITDRSQMEQAWAIRRAVFIEEQGVPEEIEIDEDDAHAFHALALEGNMAVGCGRMVAHYGYVKIGRMAVLNKRRGEGIGRSILAFLMERARGQGITRAVLHAQVTAEGFYLKNGYIAEGAVFEEAGIAHRRMSRQL
jgi:predicted GNAT family N-acyltransferase